MFGAGTLLAFTGVFTVEAYPIYVTSALVVNSLVRSAFAAEFPLFAVQMYEELGYSWATSFLAFLGPSARHDWAFRLEGGDPEEE